MYGDSKRMPARGTDPAGTGQGLTNQRVKRNGEVDEMVKAKNCTKSGVRARVETRLWVVKGLARCATVCRRTRPVRSRQLRWQHHLRGKTLMVQVRA